MISPSRSPRFLFAACVAALGGTVLVGAPPLLAQGGSISGRVTDGATKLPVPRATVQVAGTRVGATADENGRYRVGSAPAGNDTLIVRRIGYAPTRMTVTVSDGQEATLDVALVTAATSLNQVVVTGTPEGQQKREIGNVVSTIDATQAMQESQAPTMADLLSARAPGLDIAPTTGRLGAAPTVEIRGVSSLGLSNAPLIYVDGVRVSNAVGTGPANDADNGFGSQGSAVGGRLNDIDPNEIESIQIIKGPAAATIYGTEAANGVIQIITKKGTGTAPRVNLQVQNGTIYFRDPQGRLPTNDYMDSTGKLLSFNGVRAASALGYPLFKNGQQRDYVGDVSGGFSTGNYYVASSYQNDLGVEPNQSTSHYSGHGNVDISPNPKVELATSLNYVQGTDHFGADYGLSSMLNSELGDPALFNVPGAGGFYPNVPPAVPQQLFDNNEAISRFTGSVTLTNRPLDWLNHRLIIGIDNTGENDQELERFAPPNLAPFTLGDPTGRIGQNLVSRTLATVDYAATAQATLSPAWNSSTSVGGQYYRTEANQSFLGGIGFPAPGVTTVSATATALPSTQEDTVNTTIGGYIQEMVGYKDRLFLTGAVRVDNNSAFGNQFKLIAYPKASASWVVNEEPFWHVSWMNTLRLRAAFGESGRAPLAFSALRTFVPVQGPGGSTAFTSGAVGNPDLKPEVGREFEGGFETDLFRRLHLDFTYYNKATTNEIVADSVSPSIGFSGTQYRNLGQVNNYGIELQAMLPVITGSVVEWDITGNYSTARNKIVSQGNLPNIVNSFTQANIVGYPIESYFGRRVVSATVNPSTGAVTNMLCDGGSGHAPVDCATAPFEYLGSPTPTSIGSIGNSVTIMHRLRLYALVDWKAGNRLLNFVEEARCTGILGAGMCDVNFHPSKYSPTYVAESSPLAYVEQAQDQFVENASFVKLREVSATYTLPQRLVPGFQHVSVTLAARELALWTSYRGPDPEVTISPTTLIAEDQGLIPPLSYFTATINFGF